MGVSLGVVFSISCFLDYEKTAFGFARNKPLLETSWLNSCVPLFSARPLKSPAGMSIGVRCVLGVKARLLNAHAVVRFVVVCLMAFLVVVALGAAAAAMRSGRA